MKRMIFSFFVLIVGISSCDKVAENSKIVFSDLIGEWTHSFEEQEDVNGEVKIFRYSTSQEFAVSRFRDAYEFKKDGTCRYMFLHPADAHHMKDGKYTFDSENNTIRIFSKDDVFLKELTVKKLTDNLLILKITERG